MDIVNDRRVQDGCSKKRPDIFIDMGNQIIIIEIDENKHTHYDNSCENRRIMELSQDVGHRSIVLIRFNPDSYKNGDVKVASCWGIEKQFGICIVKNKKAWSERLQNLKETVNYWINNETERIIESVYLYYDENE